ncbi:MAG: hypothetical protein DMG04_16880 [Acidobacteria bacterium]|nr:MAG: hypothetical protein AUI11_12635 [Acidobacteria bacterium 13_2_20CM_2_66_4]PYQ72619.1 MAG: hypothetical protein DMG04_16880 [Acidobacteriota bacterium]PYQ84434.1 MAG: hypothetical protein DMG03_10955 [Acidobacteriota bacterium]PYQ91199.1 MAG: hypothetical protein DMG02_06545 [Acidobacteriota bacterium]PYR08357.1 MAG: hypothetical protein DMF99_19555 [Acidobacteriota bacterium]
MIGVVALFEVRDALLDAIAAARAQQLTIVTAFSPAYDPRIEAAVGVPRSAVSAWTFAGGVAGAIGGMAFTIWTVRQWPILILGGKPLVALPSFLIVAFESTILIAVCAALAGFFAGGRAMRRVARAAYEPSLSEERFGLLVACVSADAPLIGELMTRSGATAWRVVRS